MSIEDKVIAIVCEKLSVPKEEISMEKTFVEDLKADSLELVELNMKLEDDFGLTIPDEDQALLRTVGDAVNYIKKHTGNA